MRILIDIDSKKDIPEYFPRQHVFRRMVIAELLSRKALQRGCRVKWQEIRTAYAYAHRTDKSVFIHRNPPR